MLTGCAETAAKKKTGPAVDRLAARGVLFENAYAQSSWTLPSFISIFTGLYPETHGVTDRMKNWRKPSRPSPDS